MIFRYFIDGCFGRGALEQKPEDTLNKVNKRLRMKLFAKLKEFFFPSNI